MFADAVTISASRPSVSSARRTVAWRTPRSADVAAAMKETRGYCALRVLFLGRGGSDGDSQLRGAARAGAVGDRQRDDIAAGRSVGMGHEPAAAASAVAEGPGVRAAAARRAFVRRG